jgi:oligopeptide/dipeptide ABC transporter ATP-binding protein
LLEVRDLRREFRAPGAAWRRGLLRAVDGVSLDLDGGECLALVGESGSGKTTLARCITRLIEPSSGSVRFRGMDFLSLKGARLRAERRYLQPVFQDAAGALNPALRIGQALLEPILSHRLMGRQRAEQRVAELLRLVGLPGDTARRFPHEFSGGQRQRIGIARALATEPALLVADEPVSALDASVRAQILALLARLSKQDGLALLLVAHDLASVSAVASRVMVLYRGRTVEEGWAPEVLRTPRHPYTRLLRDSAPSLSPVSLADSPRDLAGPEIAAATDGCPFYARCGARQPDCVLLAPALRQVGDGRRAACHHPIDGC